MTKLPIEESDLAEVPIETKNKLHKLLYRQECRVWLLAASLVLMVTLLTADFYSDPEKRIFFWFSNLFVIFLAFWVAYPSQVLLSLLRKGSSQEIRSETERKFDGSWASVWDFVPPLVVPLVVFLILILSKLWYAF